MSGGDLDRGNRNDTTQLIPLVGAVSPIPGRRRRPRRRSRELCAERGSYRQQLRARGITPERPTRRRPRLRLRLGMERWVVGRGAHMYLGLPQPACALICYRQDAVALHERRDPLAAQQLDTTGSCGALDGARRRCRQHGSTGSGDGLDEVGSVARRIHVGDLASKRLRSLPVARVCEDVVHRPAQLLRCGRATGRRIPAPLQARRAAMSGLSSVAWALAGTCQATACGATPVVTTSRASSAKASRAGSTRSAGSVATGPWFTSTRGRSRPSAVRRGRSGEGRQGVMPVFMRVSAPGPGGCGQGGERQPSDPTHRGRAPCTG